MRRMKPWQDEQHIEIAAPPDVIYRYLADFANHLAWSETLTGIEPPPEARFVAGAEFAFLGERPEDRREVRVTALQAPMRVAWRSSTARAVEEWEFLIMPSSAATTTLAVRQTLEPRQRARWLARDRWRTKELARQNAVSLAMIKAIIEAGAGDE